MIAHLVGSTGLTGSALLDLLLQDPEITRIHSYSRSSTGKSAPKLEEHLGDLTNNNFWSRDLSGAVLFICIGTTKAKTPDEAQYYAIDHGIPVAAAQAAKKGGISKVVVISSLGAKASASNFYLRTKGEMERDLGEIYPQGLIILQPSLIMGDRNERRLLEGISQSIFKVLNPLIPKKYRGVHYQDIARAMLKLAKDQEVKTKQVVLSEQIPALAQSL